MIDFYQGITTDQDLFFFTFTCPSCHFPFKEAILKKDQEGVTAPFTCPSCEQRFLCQAYSDGNRAIAQPIILRY